jgi:hypothetical protein
VEFLYISMLSILVLFSFAHLIYVYFELQKTYHSFYNLKFHHTILYHRARLPTSSRLYFALLACLRSDFIKASNGIFGAIRDNHLLELSLAVLNNLANHYPTL